MPLADDHQHRLNETSATASGSGEFFDASDIEKEKQHWASRATKYHKLEWASRQGYLQRVVSAGDLQPADLVLDAGTGTGLVAKSAAPHVTKVVGVDISPDMMMGLQTDASETCEFELGDLRSMRFDTGYFSKAFCRMVFHGLIDSTDAAAQEIFRVLQPGGRFVVSEGTPPDRSAEEWYTRMFRLKEERLTIFPETLESILSRAGFTDIATDIHISPQVSIRNWLENSGLPAERQQQIMQIHLEMPDSVREVYNASFPEDGDVLLDMKFAIVVGIKPSDSHVPGSNVRITK